MATPTWRNVSAPGLTGVAALMNGANRLAQTGYKSISDAFTSGGQILEDKKIREEADLKKQNKQDAFQVYKNFMASTAKGGANAGLSEKEVQSRIAGLTGNIADMDTYNNLRSMVTGRFAPTAQATAQATANAATTEYNRDIAKSRMELKAKQALQDSKNATSKSLYKSGKGNNSSGYFTGEDVESETWSGYSDPEAVGKAQRIAAAARANGVPHAAIKDAEERFTDNGGGIEINNFEQAMYNHPDYTGTGGGNSTKDIEARLKDAKAKAASKNKPVTTSNQVIRNNLQNTIVPPPAVEPSFFDAYRTN